MYLFIYQFYYFREHQLTNMYLLVFTYLPPQSILLGIKSSWIPHPRSTPHPMSTPHTLLCRSPSGHPNDPNTFLYIS